MRQLSMAIFIVFDGSDSDTSEILVLRQETRQHLLVRRYVTEKQVSATWSTGIWEDMAVA